MYCINIVGLNDLNLSLNLPIITKVILQIIISILVPKKKKITFEYILDLEIPKNKVYDFFILINRINEQSSDGYFSFNINQNIIKYHSSKNYFDNLTYENLLNLIDTNLELTSGLFHNFSLFVHNLAYGDINEQGCIELMFLQIKGNA